MNWDSHSKLQESYAKSRLVWQLETLLTRSIPGVVSNLASSSLLTLDWSDAEAQSIRKIVSVLDDIHALQGQLENLSRPLIVTYKKQSSSRTTSTPSPTQTG